MNAKRRHRRRWRANRVVRRIRGMVEFVANCAESPTPVGYNLYLSKQQLRNLLTDPVWSRG